TEGAPRGSASECGVQGHNYRYRQLRRNRCTKDSRPTGFDGDVWISQQKTKGKSDLYVQSNTWQAADPITGTIASTGWHTHLQHSLIIITSGTLTEYEGSDCTKHVYTFVAGQPAPTLIDPGHAHAHLIRNEGRVPASSIAVQLVPYDPAKQNRRIDAPVPQNWRTLTDPETGSVPALEREDREMDFCEREIRPFSRSGQRSRAFPFSCRSAADRPVGARSSP